MGVIKLSIKIGKPKEELMVSYKTMSEAERHRRSGEVTIFDISTGKWKNVPVRRRKLSSIEKLLRW